MKFALIHNDFCFGFLFIVFLFDRYLLWEDTSAIGLIALGLLSFSGCLITAVLYVKHNNVKLIKVHYIYPRY